MKTNKLCVVINYQLRMRGKIFARRTTPCSGQNVWDTNANARSACICGG